MHSQNGNNTNTELQDNDSVAQLVEQMTLNHWVVGSSPTGVTIKDHRKWKTVENQTFSTVFIFAQTAKIGISEHSAV